MDNRGKIKISYKSLVVLLVSVVLLEANYWALLQKIILPSSYRYILWGIITFLPLIPIAGKITRSKMLVPWILYAGLVLFRNQEFEHGAFLNTTRIVLCLLLLFIASYNANWITGVPNAIIYIGIPNVLATLLFFLNNRFYELFISLTYKTYQSGTNFGRYGFRAALADHYSQNGTYIAIVLLALGAMFCCNGVKQKRKKYLVILIALAGFALLLTTKRAHLMFGIAVLILTYYLANPSKMMGRTFKLMIAAIVLLIVISIGIEYIPQLSDTFERFQNIGVDNASTSRIEMWEYAIDLFKKNPVIGIGWLGFTYQTDLQSTLAASVTGCHNIYLELLCECGIIGFVIFLFAAISSLVSTIRSLRAAAINEEFFKYRNAISVSFAIQVFVLLYGLTGNPIYDRTFHFYVVAVAVNIAFLCLQKRGRKLRLRRK